MPAHAYASLFSLASLQGPAGRMDRLDDFLTVAAETARRATGARDSLVLFLGEEGYHIGLNTARGEAGVLGRLVEAVLEQEMLNAAHFLGRPFESEALFHTLEEALVASAVAQGMLPPVVATLSNAGESMGLVALLDPKPAPFSRDFAAVVRQSLSTSIENFRAFAEARRHLARQSFLRDVGRIFTAGGGKDAVQTWPRLDEQIRHLLTRIQMLRGVDACSLALLDAGTGHFRTAGAIHLDDSSEAWSRNLVRQVVVSSTPYHVNDLRQTGHSDARFRCYLGVPLVRRDAVLGVLNIFGEQVEAISAKDVELFSSLSEQLALLIDNAGLLEKTQRQVQELTFVFRVSTALRQERDVAGILRTALEQCVQAVGGELGCAFLYHAQDGRLIPSAIWGGATLDGPVPALDVRGKTYDLEQRLLNTRFSDRPQSRFPELFAAPAVRGLLASAPMTLLIPLRSDQGLLGAVLIGGSRPGDLGESERRLLMTLTNVAENAAGRAMMHEEAQARVREEAASRAKSEFLAIMSHELRTPLTAILGFTEALLGELFGPLLGKQREYLQDIMQNGDHLLSLINDVLDMAKVEAGRMELEPEVLDVGLVVQEVIVAFEPAAERKKVTLTGPDPARYPSLWADRRRLKQILFNLVSNAIKFTGAGGRVEVGVRRKAASVEFSIRDSGIGIEPEDQERIFQPFFQAPHSPGKPYEGTGLGLPLTRKLVELHGGSIRVASRPGSGTTFHVTLPAKRGSSKLGS